MDVILVLVEKETKAQAVLALGQIDLSEEGVGLVKVYDLLDLLFPQITGLAVSP